MTGEHVYTIKNIMGFGAPQWVTEVILARTYLLLQSFIHLLLLASHLP